MGAGGCGLRVAWGVGWGLGVERVERLRFGGAGAAP